MIAASCTRGRNIPKLCSRQRGLRPGVELVEFAVVAPVLFILVLGLLEFSRAIMCHQVMTNAVREGARVGAMPGKSTGDVLARANRMLSDGLMNGVTVTTEPAEISGLTEGLRFTVTARVTYDNVSWLPIPQWMRGRTLQAQSNMRREAN